MVESIEGAFMEQEPDFPMGFDQADDLTVYDEAGVEAAPLETGITSIFGMFQTDRHIPIEAMSAER